MTYERVEIGEHVLYRGDCREHLPALEVDCIVTDPPYGIGLRNGDVDGHRSDHWDTIQGDDSPEVGLFILDYARSRGLPIAMFASPWKPWPGRWRNQIVWDKGGAVGGGGDIATTLKRTWELIQVWNPNPLNGERAESVWRHPITPGDTTEHICAKPVKLMARLVTTFTQPADIVCDPCMGVGATGVACVFYGRRFVGCEIEKRYFDIACRRIEAAMGVGTMFDATRPEMASLFGDE